MPSSAKKASARRQKAAAVMACSSGSTSESARRLNPSTGECTKAGPGRRAMRTAGAILQASHALALVATPPDIGPIPRDVHRLGGVGYRPTGFDALTQPASTFRGERGVTVHRSLRCEWVSLADPHSPRRLHSLVDPVSKVHGHYS